MSAPTLAEKVAETCDSFAQHGHPSFKNERRAVAALVREGAVMRAALGADPDGHDAWDTALSALASALGVSDAD